MSSDIIAPTDFERNLTKHRLLDRMRAWPYPGGGQESFYFDEDKHLFLSAMSNDFGDFYTNCLAPQFQEAANSLYHDGQIIKGNPFLIYDITLSPVGLTSDQIWCLIHETNQLGIVKSNNSVAVFSEDEIFIPDQDQAAIINLKKTIKDVGEGFTYVDLGAVFRTSSGLEGRLVLSHSRDSAIARFLSENPAP